MRTISDADTKAVSAGSPDMEAWPLAPDTHRYAAAFSVDGRIIARATSITEGWAIRQVQNAAKGLLASSLAGAVLSTRPLRPEELRPVPSKPIRIRKTPTNGDLLREIQMFEGPLHLSNNRGAGGGVLLLRHHVMSILSQDLDGPACARFKVRHGKGCLTLAKLEQEGTTTPMSEIVGLLLGSWRTCLKTIPCDLPTTTSSTKSVSSNNPCEGNTGRMASTDS